AEMCRSCKAAIRWAVSVKGKRIPLDADPLPDGNLRLYRPDPMGHVLRLPPSRAIFVPRPERVEGELLFVTHFATCPYAEEHRKGEEDE
ncbi:MAG: hypothetical protein L3J91_03015, partial [Thermoplasmata archaeon]|nr:hypothetical protein [Thermoplasmata archaeon]